MSTDSCVLKEPNRFGPGGLPIDQALQNDSGMRAAETGESDAQAGNKRREGWDSQRGSIQHVPMLDATDGLVKRY